MRKLIIITLIILIGVSIFVVNQYFPWIIKIINEISYEQRDVTKRHLIADGIEVATTQQEYAPGDTVLLTIHNNTRIELEYHPTSFHKVLNFGIDGLRTKSCEKAFTVAPGNAKTVSLVIPATADPGQYRVGASYVHMDWAPGGEDLVIRTPDKYIEIAGPPPLPIPDEGQVEQHSENHASVYLGKKTYVEAVMGAKPLELEFILPEGVGYAKIKGISLNTYEKHAEYLWFKVKNGQPSSGSNVPPEIPAEIHFNMELDSDSATPYGYIMKYQDWVKDKKPLRFQIIITMDAVY